jgi:hypothetical protein
MNFLVLFSFLREKFLIIVVIKDNKIIYELDNKIVINESSIIWFWIIEYTAQKADI